MSEAWFYLHIAGAIATLGAVVVSLRALIKQNQTKDHALALAAIAGWQLVTGVGIVLSTPEVSLTHLCLSGAIYLAVVGSLEYVVVKRLSAAPAR